MTALEPGITIDAYQRFNLQADQGVLFWQWAKRGFGAELTSMLSAMVYAAEHGMEFRLCSRYSNIALRHGWQDYFEPFCQESFHLLLIRSCVRKPDTIGAHGLSLFTRMPLIGLGRRIALSHEVFPLLLKGEFANRQLSIPELEFESISVHELSSLFLRAIWRPISSTTLAIGKRLEPFHLNDGEPFAAIHVRRGDKIKEAQQVSLDNYINTLTQHEPSCPRVFVATDDFSVVREFRDRWPQFAFVTRCTPEYSGHLQKRFNRQSRITRYEQTLDLISDFTAMRNASIFVGTFSSNVGRVAYFLRAGENCHSVDIPHL